jgi:hypothetical protein
MKPSLGPLARTVNIDDDELGSLLLSDLSDRRLEFENGRFQKTASDFDVIKSLSFNYESIHVNVGGVGEVAELVVADAAEMVWASTAVAKRWTEIKQGVQLISYGTATYVDLGFPFEDLLHNDLNKFFKAQVIDGTKYASAMGAYSIRNSFKKTPSISAIYGLDDLTIKVFLFNTITGRSESVQIRFSVTSKDTIGTGIVLVVTEMPFETHINFIDTLRNTMRRT